MRVPPFVLPTADAVGARAAETIADGIERAAAERRGFLLGCPSGRSPLTTYEHLARLVAERDLDLSHVVVVLMDEYVVRSGDGFVRVDPSLPHSCLGFGRRDIVERVNAAAGEGRGITDDRLWCPDPGARDGDYDETIRAAGGIDVFLLASGASDGHVALNPPLSSADSVTRVVALDEATRRDNLGTFPSFAGLDEVPTHGVTVGISTIRDLSRSVVMVVTGGHKQETVRRLANAESYEPEWPATILSDCADGVFFADRDAAGRLLATS